MMRAIRLRREEEFAEASWKERLRVVHERAFRSTLWQHLQQRGVAEQVDRLPADPA